MSDATKKDLWSVPSSKLITKEGFNIRYDMGDIKSLAENIKENGVKDPLQGYREGEFFVIKDGHRRKEALDLLLKEGLEIKVPFILEPKNYNPEQRIVDMFVMNDGKSLTPLEQANGVERLLNYNWSNGEIAKKIGRSEAYVGRLILLINAPKKLKRLIETGRIAASLAMDILARNEVEEFLKGIEEGTFVATGEEVGEGKEKSEKKITKKVLKEMNSWKEFKKWMKDIDPSEFSEEKKKVFSWLKRMMNNELTENSFGRFFKN